MTIDLNPELESKANRLVANGRFRSVQEAIEAGLGVIAEDEAWRQYACDRIDRGVADIAAGRTISGDKLLERLRSARLKQA